MPPKTGGGQKGPSNKEYYDDINITDEIVAASARLEALKSTYLERMKHAAEKQEQNLLLQQGLEEVKGILADKTEEQKDVMTDYTRQYKADEAEKIEEIAVLDAAVNRLQEEQLRLEKEIEDCEAEYDAKIKEKRAELVAIAQRTTEMEKEFAAMLSDIQQSVGAA